MKSIMQADDGTCYLCKLLEGNDWPQQTEEHHAIFGRGMRPLSERYGLKVYLCLKHHRTSKVAVHLNHEMAYIIQAHAQMAYQREQARGNKKFDRDFKDVFGRYYPMESDEND